MLTLSYDRPSRWFHWLIVSCVALALAFGFVADATAAKGPLFTHIFFGISAAGLSLCRLAWWLLRPKPPQHQLNILARVVHTFLAFIPALMAVSGIGMIVIAGGLGTLWQAVELPVFENIRPRIPHGIAARVLLLLIAVHVIGAAKQYLPQIKALGSSR